MRTHLAAAVAMSAPRGLVRTQLAGEAVFMQNEGINSLIGVRVDGTYVRRHHHGRGRAGLGARGHAARRAGE